MGELMGGRWGVELMGGGVGVELMGGRWGVELMGGGVGGRRRVSLWMGVEGR